MGGCTLNMVRKVSWGQIVQELEFQTKVFRLIMETMISKDGSFLSEPLKLLNKGNDMLGLQPLHSYPLFLSNQIYVHLSLWLMSGNPFIFPQGNIFLVDLKKKETEDPMSISKKRIVPGQ